LREGSMVAVICLLLVETSCHLDASHDRDRLLWILEGGLVFVDEVPEQSHVGMDGCGGLLLLLDCFWVYYLVMQRDQLRLVDLRLHQLILFMQASPSKVA
jgi:hypothetical protein